MPISITLRSRTKAIRTINGVFEDKTSLDQIKVIDIKNNLKSSTKLDPLRQRLTTVDKKVLDDDDKTLAEYGLQEGDDILFKDLGPQISWKTVFLIEYLGPLLIHPLFYTSNPFSNLIYGSPVTHGRMQRIAFVMVMAHFLKRQLETIFVHRFSNATMPIRNIFKNSFHYWVLSGFLLAGPIYGHGSSLSKLRGTIFESKFYLGLCTLLWAYAEISNLIVHLHLRSLRPAGTKKRALPIGYGFKLVACPNYLFESLAWLSYCLLTCHWSSLVFLMVSSIQMSIWAVKKKKNYKREFGALVSSGWKAIYPFIL
ncbi:hypothetical protein O181_008989 [Austropuccinia psidii MF-1]|uniref:Ubiquitin-like domain-containing protein n=1 Tax=Austropuccinia psidii MF-1 TaxID=1389203 RepID=A0A9Q3BNH4_9BASI|nr:hypothetical protein [Austropuccinia psidii MF-1]